MSRRKFFVCLCFVVGAEHVYDLVLYDLLDRSSRIAEVLSRVEVVGVFGKVFADRRRARHAQVRVDVDLADRHRGRFPEHLFGDADRVGHFSAELVDDRHSVLRHGRSAVQNDGESGQAFASGRV